MGCNNNNNHVHRKFNALRHFYCFFFLLQQNIKLERASCSQLSFLKAKENMIINLVMFYTGIVPSALFLTLFIRIAYIHSAAQFDINENGDKTLH